MRMGDTIVALSSGSLPAGVAVLRISGPRARDIVAKLCGDVPSPRLMQLRSLRFDGVLIDSVLVAFFPSPHSFTGEDCVELHCHGSVAVVQKLLDVITEFDDVRLAEAGEFTRRAFENGKLDLVEAEGLSDLISAQTESQRRQAVSRMDGALSGRIDVWRQSLLQLRAEIEARLDFSDESDVDLSLPPSWLSQLDEVRDSIAAAISESIHGRIIRDGYRVALAGPPNAGKSSLLNALSRSDVAIVSSEEGTTRDVREVPLDLSGQLVILLDLAGLRETQSLAEAEGVRRAEAEIRDADLVLWLSAYDNPSPPAVAADNLIVVGTKTDLGTNPKVDISVSSKSGLGISDLLQRIESVAGQGFSGHKNPLVSHKRDLDALVATSKALDAVDKQLDSPELAAESLRQASDSLARLIGLIEPEHILDQLFSRFCIGK